MRFDHQHELERALPDDLSDDAALQLIEALQQLAYLVELRYFCTPRAETDKRQLPLPLWTDPPF